MASKTIEVDYVQGYTGLKVELYAHGTDTLSNTGGDTLTEATNRKGVYTAAYAEAVTGLHRFLIKSGTVTLATGFVDIVDDVEATYVGHYGAAIQVTATGEVVTSGGSTIIGPTPYFTSAGVAAANVTATNTYLDTHERTGNNWILDPDIH